MDWHAKRRQLFNDGVCVIEDILDNAMLSYIQTIANTKIATLSTAHRKQQKSTGSMVANRYLPQLDTLITWPQIWHALDHLGYSDSKFSRAYLISKPAYSPQLFWHQDFTAWRGESRAYASISPQLFAMFYLVDTTPKNGCLRIIPGSHRQRHALHNYIGSAHSAASRNLEDPTSPLYSFVEDELDITARAGDMILGDGRALHAAHANRTADERPLITIWYHPLFSQLGEATQRQISDLAQAEIADWPKKNRQTIAPVIANYKGTVPPLPRDRIPGPELT